MTPTDPSADQRPGGAYEGTGGDGDAPTVVFRAAPGPGEDEGALGEPEPVASRAEDPAVGWSDAEGVQAVAQAILTHHTGSEPDQAELEALVMAVGDTWTANAAWSLDVSQLEDIL